MPDGRPEDAPARRRAPWSDQSRVAMPGDEVGSTIPSKRVADLLNELLLVGHQSRDVARTSAGVRGAGPNWAKSGRLLMSNAGKGRVSNFCGKGPRR